MHKQHMHMFKGLRLINDIKIDNKSYQIRTESVQHSQHSIELTHLYKFLINMYVYLNSESLTPIAPSWPAYDCRRASAKQMALNRI